MRIGRVMMVISLLVLTLSSRVLAQAERLNVVATFSILGDVVHAIGGDKIDLTVLVGPDGDTHSYEPVPQDSVALTHANVIFENGLGFETWLDDMIAAAGAQGQRIVTSQGIAAGVINVGDDAGATDPHIWQNAYNYVRVAESIRDTLMTADPANSITYQLNANAYIAQLLETDTYIVQHMQALAPERRKIVTNHDAFGYFASRYGLEIVGTALGSVSTEGASGSAANIVQLVNTVRETGARAIFAENIENADMVNQIAQEAGVVVGAPLCSDALTPPDGSCPTYLQLLRYNTDSIVAALKS